MERTFFEGGRGDCGTFVEGGNFQGVPPLCMNAIKAATVVRGRVWCRVSHLIHTPKLVEAT